MYTESKENNFKEALRTEDLIRRDSYEEEMNNWGKKKLAEKRQAKMKEREGKGGKGSREDDF